MLRPVSVCDVVSAPLPDMSVQSGSQAEPPSALTRTWYLVMALSAGLVQPSAMAASPPVAVRFVGAGGGSGVGVGIAVGSGVGSSVGSGAGSASGSTQVTVMGSDVALSPLS